MAPVKELKWLRVQRSTFYPYWHPEWGRESPLQHSRLPQCTRIVRPLLRHLTRIIITTIIIMFMLPINVLYWVYRTSPVGPVDPRPQRRVVTQTSRVTSIPNLLIYLSSRFVLLRPTGRAGQLGAGTSGRGTGYPPTPPRRRRLGRLGPPRRPPPLGSERPTRPPAVPRHV